MRIIEGGVTALRGVVLMALFLWGDVFGYTLYIGGYIEGMAASNLVMFLSGIVHI